MIEQHQKILSNIFITLILTSFFGGCAWREIAQFTPPLVSLTHLSPGYESDGHQNFLIGLRIQNPNAVALPIKGMYYSIDINGQSFASGTLNQQINIGAFSTTELEIPISLNIINSIRIATNLLLTSPDAINYSLTGTIGVDIYGMDPVSIEESGTIELRNNK